MNKAFCDEGKNEREKHWNKGFESRDQLCLVYPVSHHLQTQCLALLLNELRNESQILKSLMTQHFPREPIYYALEIS